jgi:hypothetical protein
LEQHPFCVPLALPGDAIAPERFTCFKFDGKRGLYIHPNIWHEGVFPLRGTQRFFDNREPFMLEFLSTWHASLAACLKCRSSATDGLLASTG